MRGLGTANSGSPALLSRRRMILSAASLGVMSVPACAHGPSSARTMALTFDDLPYLAPQQRPLADAQRVTRALTRTLRHYRAPAVAFVNEGRLHGDGEVEARTALLREWMDSRAVLGNHTYSHLDFNTATLEDFSADVLRGRAISDEITRRRAGEPRYFRFPYNHTGPSLEAKQAMEVFLTSHHYIVAPYTIDSADMTFNTVYVDARARGDSATAERVQDAYIDFVMAATGFAEAIAPRVVGRDIPQILLLHAIDLNADCLDHLLQGLHARSYRFVTLQKAMEDPAYQIPDTLVTRFGPTWLWRWRQSLRLNVSFNDDPEPPPWVSEAAARIQASSS